MTESRDFLPIEVGNPNKKKPEAGGLSIREIFFPTTTTFISVSQFLDEFTQDPVYRRGCSGLLRGDFNVPGIIHEKALIDGKNLANLLVLWVLNGLPIYLPDLEERFDPTANKDHITTNHLNGDFRIKNNELRQFLLGHSLPLPAPEGYEESNFWFHKDPASTEYESLRSLKSYREDAIESIEKDDKIEDQAQEIKEKDETIEKLSPLAQTGSRFKRGRAKGTTSPLTQLMETVYLNYIDMGNKLKADELWDVLLEREDDDFATLEDGIDDKGQEVIIWQYREKETIKDITRPSFRNKLSRIRQGLQGH